MELNSLNIQSLSNPIMIDSSSPSVMEPPFKHIESQFSEMMDQILADTRVSATERNIIEQFKNAAENTSGMSLGFGVDLANQLIDSSKESPYLYYYHFLRGAFTLFGEEGTLTETYVQTKALEIVKDMDESIQLKGDFSDAYYIRGIAQGLSGNMEQGIQDIQTAMIMGSPDARDFMFQLFEKL